MDFLFPKGFNIGLINPIQTDSLRSSNIQKTKNDKIDTFTKLLSSASKGHYSYDEAVKLKNLAKESIGIDNPALEIQVQCIINQLALLKEQINSIIKKIMDSINSIIFTIPGISYTLGATILSEIGDIHRFSNPTKLLAYAGLHPSVRQSRKFLNIGKKIDFRY